jgi:hypothetical protein
LKAASNSVLRMTLLKGLPTLLKKDIYLTGNTILSIYLESSEVMVPAGR